MRRTLAAVILGPSLLLASLAWSAFGLLNTMLNPERSEKVATVLLDDPIVQQQLRETVAGAVGSQLPDAVPVSEQMLEDGAGIALDNPAVELVIRDAFVQAHQAFLGEAEIPSEVDLGAAAGDVRSNTLADIPGANELLPESPSLTIDLPTQNIPNLGGFRRWLARVAPLMALAAVAGVGLALLTTTDRPKVLRRAGVWALGASVVWLILNLAVPWAANEWFSGQAAIAASLIDAMFGEMLRPALVLAGLGIGLFVASLVVPVVQRTSGRASRTDGGVVMRRSNDLAGGLPEPLYQAPARPARTPQPLPDSPPVIPPPARPTASAAPTVAPQAAPGPAPASEPKPPPVEQEWIPGVGYVDPGSAPAAEPTPEPPPAPSAAPPAPEPKPEPTWIPGVGYVDDPPE